MPNLSSRLLDASKWWFIMNVKQQFDLNGKFVVLDGVFDRNWR